MNPLKTCALFPLLLLSCLVGCSTGHQSQPTGPAKIQTPPAVPAPVRLTMAATRQAVSDAVAEWQVFVEARIQANQAILVQAGVLQSAGEVSSASEKVLASIASTRALNSAQESVNEALALYQQSESSLLLKPGYNPATPSPEGFSFIADKVISRINSNIKNQR